MIESSNDFDRNDYIDKCVREYEEVELTNVSLWEQFREDFKEWIVKNFKSSIQNHRLRRLRNHLRRESVWMLKNEKITIAQSLYNTLQKTKSDKWTKNEILKWRIKKKFRSDAINYLIETDFDRKPSSEWLSIIQTSNQNAHIQANANARFRVETTTREYESILHAITKINQQKTIINQQNQELEIDENGTNQELEIDENETNQELEIDELTIEAATNQQNQGQNHELELEIDELAIKELGPIIISNQSRTIDYEKKIDNLIKMYTDETKYSEENDSFSFKLIMFHDICRRAKLSHEVKSNAFLIMLKRLALNYYYAHLSINNDRATFDDVCFAIKSYFEESEYKRSVLSRWNTLSLQKTMNKNEKKSIEKCLQILLKKLRHFQHELESKLQIDAFFYNKLIIICRNVSACRYACYKLFETMTELINNLRSFIVTYHEFSIIESAFFIDRRYHKQSDHRTFYSISTSNHSSRSYSSRDRIFTSFSRASSKSDKSNTKRCFVCDKESCWSIRHTRNEKNQVIKRQRDCFVNRFANRYDRRVRQYIIEYEREDEDENHEINDEMKTLILETFNESISTFNELTLTFNESLHNIAFFASFERLDQIEISLNQAETIITKLINRSLMHDIASSCSINSINDSFIYIFIERYNDHQFHDLMIDIDVSRHSTADYDQYLVYQKKQNHTVQLNIIIVDTVNVQFEIESTSFIDSMNVQLSIEIIKFHVIKANTLFLFSLIDMNRLEVFFDNIRNVLIDKNITMSAIRRFEHAFLLWENIQTCIVESLNSNSCYLISIELDQLHKRFEHFSAERLHRILERSEHDDDISWLKAELNKLIKLWSFC